MSTCTRSAWQFGSASAAKRFPNSSCLARLKSLTPLGLPLLATSRPRTIGAESAVSDCIHFFSISRRDQDGLISATVGPRDFFLRVGCRAFHSPIATGVWVARNCRCELRPCRRRHPLGPHRPRLGNPRQLGQFAQGEARQRGHPSRSGRNGAIVRLAPGACGLLAKEAGGAQQEAFAHGPNNITNELEEIRRTSQTTREFRRRSFTWAGRLSSPQPRCRTIPESSAPRQSARSCRANGDPAR